MEIVMMIVVFFTGVVCTVAWIASRQNLYIASTFREGKKFKGGINDGPPTPRPSRPPAPMAPILSHKATGQAIMSDKIDVNAFAVSTLQKTKAKTLVVMEINTDLNSEANGKWVRYEDYLKLKNDTSAC